MIADRAAKIFEQLFCEAFLTPATASWVFSPHFPTHLPNIGRRAGPAPGWPTYAAEDRFRPRLWTRSNDFSLDRPAPKAIFLNSPHNRRVGVTTEEDLRGLADLVRGRDVAVFSDEPDDQMVWRGTHIIRAWPSPACSTGASRPTRSASPTA